MVKWDLEHGETSCPWRSLSRPAPLGHRMYCRLAWVSKMLALLGQVEETLVDAATDGVD